MTLAMAASSGRQLYNARSVSARSCSVGNAALQGIKASPCTESRYVVFPSILDTFSLSSRSGTARFSSQPGYAISDCAYSSARTTSLAPIAYLVAIFTRISLFSTPTVSTLSTWTSAGVLQRPASQNSTSTNNCCAWTGTRQRCLNLKPARHLS